MVVEAWRWSGEPRDAFVRRHGIHPWRLRRWAKRLGPGTAAVVRFHPVRITGSNPGPSAAEPIEIVIGDDLLYTRAAWVRGGRSRAVLAVLAAGAAC